MVLSMSALKSGLKTVEEEICAVRRVTRALLILKVILETCLLKDEGKVTFFMSLPKKSAQIL